MNFNQCAICKLKAYIQCEQCLDKQIFFCSRGHLFIHKNKYHRALSANVSKRQINQQQEYNINQNNNKYYNNNNPPIDIKKLYDHLQTMKKDILIKMQNQLFSEAIEQINKSLNLARQFYNENHPFIIELLYTKAECYLNLSNLDETKNNLETIIMLTEKINVPNQNSIYRFKANMLLGAISMNLGEFNVSLKAYTQCENELNNICKEPELNVKLSAVYLNLGLCYIYLNNLNIAEKYFKKGLSQTEGILGNDTIHKLNSDLFENLGVIYEQNNKYKDALVYYKKALKLKFNLYGENHDEVLELQYKISSVYLSLKQYKEAEEILSSMIEVVLKEKINYATQETIYRYSAYFYTLGVIYIKLNKSNQAKFYLLKAKENLEGFLSNNDPLFNNIQNLIKITEQLKKNNI